jgi:signal transduction histidine kinase
MRNLIVVLGDQLSLTSVAFEGFDAAQDRVWMAEVPQESQHVPSTKMRTALFLSAMRHFAEALTARGMPLDYLKLGTHPFASLEAALTDTLSRHRPGAVVTVEPLPPVESDRMAVEQILSNLVENAIKYLSPARSGEIRIAGQRAGQRVEIDVSDNGRGIAPQDHERIFELFRRSGSQDQPGEGIGLAHVRALAYRLGGLIEVESELDRGARFRLSLPVKFSVEQSDEQSPDRQHRDDRG